MADYSKMTDEEFEQILTEVVAGMSAGQILGVPGVHEVLREELNNEVLYEWADRNEDKAYPNEDDES